jgi:hypothetical protein
MMWPPSGVGPPSGDGSVVVRHFSALHFFSAIVWQNVSQVVPPSLQHCDCCHWVHTHVFTASGWQSAVLQQVPPSGLLFAPPEGAPPE